MVTIRIGIVGCGSISGTHAQAISELEGAVVSALFDVLPERTDIAAAKFGGRACSSLEELFDLVDAVCLCVPSGLHGTIGVAAARAGKHVLTEKPIDVTLAAATSLIDTCRSAGVTLGVISQHRFSAGIQQIRRQVQSGEFGRMLAADVYVKWHRTQAYYDSGAWRGTAAMDGGCLMNQGIHYIDMVQWIMGGVKSLRAVTKTLAHDIEAEDVANVLLEYRSGAVGVLQGATCCFPGFGERIEVHGTFGSAIVEEDVVRLFKIDPQAVNEGLYGGGVMAQPAPNVSSYDSGGQPPKHAWGELHRLQIADFCQSVRVGRAPAVSGSDGLESLKVILAAYESGRNDGSKVEIAQTLVAR